MEYLDGYRRLEYREHDPRMYRIENRLIDQGFFVIDFAPINFMVKDGDIRMVDLDTLARISDFTINHKAMIPELLWYGSRVLKDKSRGQCLVFERNYKPHA